MEQIVINRGVIYNPEFKTHFIFRSMLNMAIGYGYLYLREGEKTPEIVNMEMAVMAHGDKNAPVYHRATNQALPIFWEDEMPDVPVMSMNLYAQIMAGKFQLVSIDEEFQGVHQSLFAIYQRFYVKNDHNNANTEEKG